MKEKSNNTDKSCSIFFYEGHIGYSPTIINLAKILDEQGFSVQIYANEKDCVPPGEMAGVKIVYFPASNMKKTLEQGKFQHIVKSFSFCLDLIKHRWQGDLSKVDKTKSINIGVDFYGSIAALLFYFIFKTKFFILSLELYNPPKTIEKILRLAYRKSEGVIIQDEDRFQTLCKQYGYQHPNVFYLPNSPMPLKEISSETGRENYLREKFNLSQEEFPHIILQAGAIGDFVCSKAIVTAFASIDNGSALILNASSKGSKNNPYVKSLHESNSKNLFLSLNPVPYDEIYKIYSSATIGVAVYQKNLGDNFNKISKASGKIAEYLKYGKPVLLNDLPGLLELVEKYKFGVVIKDPSNSKEIELAIEQILNSYEWYSNNAKVCFDAEFDFTKNVLPILSEMNSLVGCKNIMKSSREDILTVIK
jgi:glycosyltransferase involved in cell wall biosynthesis